MNFGVIAIAALASTRSGACRGISSPRSGGLVTRRIACIEASEVVISGRIRPKYSRISAREPGTISAGISSSPAVRTCSAR